MDNVSDINFLNCEDNLLCKICICYFSKDSIVFSVTLMGIFVC
jgi:hypothetical protein